MENQAVQKVNQTLAMTSREGWLKECSPLSIAKVCRHVKTPAQAFQSGLPTLARVNKHFGRDFTESYLAIWITNLVEYFQVGRKMGEQQIIETAMLVMDEYYMLTLADINLVFTRVKKGYFGEIYDRIDGAVILGWFKKYFEERCSEAEALSMREHEKYAVTGAPRVGQAHIQAHKEAIHKYNLEKMQNGNHTKKKQ